MRNRLSKEEKDLLNCPQESTAVESIKKTSSVESPSPALVELHEHFALGLVQSFSDVCSKTVDVSLRDQSIGSFSQFIFGQPVPCCCAVVTSKAADIEFYLSVKPSILYPVIDRMVGAKSSEEIPRRPMTEIERGLIEVLFEQVITSYEDAWCPVLSLELSLDRLVGNIQAHPFQVGSEPTYLVRYDVRFDCYNGFVDLCIPWSRSRQIRDRLDALANS